jgi:signal transduction histidine kinase
MSHRRAFVLLQLLAVGAAAAAMILLRAQPDPIQTLVVLVALGVAASLGVLTLRSLDREAFVREEMRRVKSTLLGNVSHELRTPLNAILGYAEILTLMPSLARPDRDHMVARILSNATGLTCAVNNLLEYSALMAGEVALRCTQVSLGELFDEIEPVVGLLIGDKPIEFSWSVGPEVGSFETDRAKLRQVLLNLLANAARFTQAGAIHLAAASDAAGLEIVVADTGVGMPAVEEAAGPRDDRQTWEATDTPHGGIGIGLVLARRLAELLGGAIVIESPPAAGTRVALHLPRAASEPATAGRAAAA